MTKIYQWRLIETDGDLLRLIVHDNESPSVSTSLNKSRKENGNE